ncbi:YjiG family protein [Serratia aquatilis]|uniref:YjiG family protein n=1 Tax=Serratia aquatilis TaxID=1737515 RepID=A0ABV6E902_9GAMM
MSNPSKPMITDVFVAGARKGWGIATSSTLPNVLMAFVIIKALEITGTLKGLGMIFSPLMNLFGLPGEAAAVLIGGWMSMGGGIGVAVSLFANGTLTGEHLAILAPAIYLMGSQIQYAGRILGVIGTKASKIPVMIAISVINAFIAMFLMRIFIG